MRRAFIHIGQHKTGTTTLQNILACNDNWFARHGYLFPKAGRLIPTGGHHKFAWCMSGNERNLEAFNVGDKAAIIDGVRREIQDWSGNVIISAEGLSHLTYDEDRLRGLREFFEEQQYEVCIVVYLRSQYRLINSVYVEQVKSFNPKVLKTFEDFAEDKITNKFYNYARWLESWDRVFGGKLIVRPFENRQFFNDDLAQDFFHAVAPELLDAFDELGPITSLNQSLSATQVAACREMARILVSRDADPKFKMRTRRKYVPRIRDLDVLAGPPYSGLTKSIISVIYKRFAGSNGVIGRKYLGKVAFFEENPDEIDIRNTAIDFADIDGPIQAQINDIIAESLKFAEG